LVTWGSLGAQGKLEIESQNLLPLVASAFVSLYWMFWTMTAAALSTI
jgi:hypothetical protein